MKEIDIAKEIERLLQFGRKHELIENMDVIPCRNALLEVLQVKEPYHKEVPEEEIQHIGEILDGILEYAGEIGLLKENTTTYKDLLDAKLMGLLMPRQSEFIKNFRTILKEQGASKATDWFYGISKASNYIRMDRIAKNLYWGAPTEYGVLDITINLSKPEKDPKEIAASKLQAQSNYPKCLLCVDNVGYAGHINHPARQNHRVIPLALAQEQWYFQYSPYVYYNEHCIIFHENHVPMKISEKTFVRLLDFIEQFPHYFIGSNADIPIVGGSILSHEHFQGGRHVFPMATASVEASFAHPRYQGVKIGIVKWPMSVIRISGKDKKELIKLSIEILEHWKNYSDETVEIISHSEINKEKICHNTITPIARKNAGGEFEIDLVLRNNRISEEHPDGIFHPHRELHHIKKENIGLIEVMGLAVLPSRLNTELEGIKKILMGEMSYLEEAKVEESSVLHKHVSWIEALVNKYGSACSMEEASTFIKEEVGQKFLEVLLHAGVYKRDEKGKQGFFIFMESLGFKKCKASEKK